MSKGILFSGEMVKAILDGRKTVTRRLVKPQPHYIESSGRWCWPIPKSKQRAMCCKDVVTASREWWEYLLPEQFPYQPATMLPERPTKAGWYEVKWEPWDEWDRVWLFEGGSCWGHTPNDDLESIALDVLDPSLTEWRTPGEVIYVRETFGKDRFGKYHYRADYPEHDCEPYPIWHPSIHMPREAARLFLLVKSVRVERLQEITERDAFAEGIAWSGVKLDVWDGTALPNAVLMFQKLWDSINGKKYPWESNPWVFVIEFERKEEAR